jgi:signal transduction histidine kinase/ActR/RegA family two-component response regulator
LQLLAGLIIGIASVTLREAGKPLLGDVKAFVYFVIPILLTGYAFGAVASLMVVLCALTYTWITYDVTGGLSLRVATVPDFWAMILHVVVGLMCMAFMEYFRTAQKEESRLLGLSSRTANMMDSLIDNSPHGIAIYDRERRRVRGNPCFQELLELQDPEEGAEPTTLDEDLGEMAELIKPVFSRVMATGRTENGVLTPSPTRSNRFFTFSLHVVNDEGGIPNWVALIVTDISELQQASEERDRLLEREQMLRREAETAIQLKDEFTAMLSHELRTPLTAILGWAELLKNHPTGDQFVEDASDAITQSTRTQMRMVEDMLDLSRVRTGRMRLDMGVVDVAELAEDVARQYRLSAEREIYVESADGCLVMGDYQRLTQILSNILQNAVKYGNPLKPIEVRVECDPHEVTVKVRDYGMGIEAGMLDTIFDRFRQVEGGSRRRFGGLGLGLAIVRELVQLHGGRVYAESPGLGMGATFTVHLPAAPEAVAGMQMRLSTASPAADPDALRGVRVLLLDDEPQTRIVLERMLTSVGAEVETLDSAIRAMEVLSESEFDLLLSDIGLPVMDGLELIAQVRAGSAGEHARGIPAVAISAYARPKDRQAALDAGFDGYVTKPIDLMRLVLAIRSVEGLRRAK